MLEEVLGVKMLKMALMLAIACLISCTKSDTLPEKKSAEPPSVQTEPLKSRPQQLQIAMEDRACKTDKDCSTVAIQCSCHCGEGVNKIHLEKYQAQYPSLCDSYTGKLCGKICEGETKCLNKVCTYDESAAG